MKSMKDLGFGPHTYLIEDEDLPFKVDSNSIQKEVRSPLKEERRNKIKESKVTSKKDEKELVIESLVKLLKQKKIHVLRWDDPKTKSSYLKLDWGVLSTVRIGPEKGSNQYPYKYNVIVDTTEGSVKYEKGVVRSYYTTREVSELIASIEIDREEKACKYGRSNYLKYMVESQKKMKNQKGFFEGARIV